MENTINNEITGISTTREMLERKTILFESQELKNIDWKEILFGGADHRRFVLLTKSNLVYSGETTRYYKDYGDIDHHWKPIIDIELETLLPRRFRKTNWVLHAFSTQAICLTNDEDSNPQYLLYDRVKREWEQITDRENDKLKEVKEQAESENKCFTPVSVNDDCYSNID